MSISRLTIKADVLNYLGPHFHPKLKRFMGQPLTTTGAGSTTTLVDSALARGTPSPTDYNGFQIEMVEGITGGVADGTIADGPKASVTDGGLTAASGTLTVAPTMAAATVASQDYLLIPPNLSSESINAEIAKVQRATEGPALWLPSLIADADFDAADLANWPDAVGTPTQTFDTTSANLLFGERALKVVTANLGDGVHHLTAVPVSEGETFVVSAFVSCPTGSVKVQLYDVTNAAEISSVTVDDPDFRHVFFTAAAPSGCEQVRVRFLSATATTTFYVSPGVVLASNNPRYYIPPSWIMEQTIDEQFELSPGYSTIVSQAYIALSGQTTSLPRSNVLRWDRGVNPLLVGQLGSSWGVHVISGYRPFAELTTNIGTTQIDREYIKWKVCANILDAHDDPRWKKCDDNAMARAYAIGYGKREKRLRENAEVMLGSRYY